MLRANSDGAHKARGSNIARFERPKYFGTSVIVAAQAVDRRFIDINLELHS